MTTAAEWLAEFDRRAEQFRAEQAAFHREVGERIRAEAMVGRRRLGPPVLLCGPLDFDIEEGLPPDGARAAGRAALAAGWAARLVHVLAAVPGKGPVESWSLRARRHDERLAAVWVHGGFADGYYTRPRAGLELLGWETLGQRAASIARWPTTKSGMAGKPPPKPLVRRGVLDAINGVRLT